MGIGVGIGVAVGTGVAVGLGVGVAVGDGMGVAVGDGAIVGVGCTAVGDGSTTSGSAVSLPQAIAAMRSIAMGTARNFITIIVCSLRVPALRVSRSKETAPVYQKGLDMNQSHLM